MKNLNKQKGFAVIMAILIIVSIVMSLTSYLYLKSSESYGDFYQTEESRIELITQVQEELENFYVSHANEFSAETLPEYIDEEYIKNNLRIPSNSSSFLKIGISTEKVDNSVRWRNLYAWLPATDGLDNSSFNPDSAFDTAFSKGDGVVWTGYSGINYESERLASAKEQLDSIAGKMQSMFVANVNQDFFKNMEVNYFAGCEERPPYANELPSISCSPAGELIKMSETNAQESLGLASTSFSNPWGRPIYIVNQSKKDGSGESIPTPVSIGGEDVYVNSGSIPYNVILVSETPVEDGEIHLIVNQIL